MVVMCVSYKGCLRHILTRATIANRQSFLQMTSIIPAIPPPVCVLVVEDEPLVRMLAVDTLTEAGYAVLESPHAEHALKTLIARASEVAILFSDINLPGNLTGLELACCARLRWPWISMMLTSGKIRPEVNDMPCGCRFLSKPYSLSHVLAHFHEMSVH
jgi:DNA-binding response OmpR family regulator